MNILSSFVHKDRGEIATIVALGAVGILMLGLVVGQYIVQRQTNLPSKAQTGLPDLVVENINVTPGSVSGYYTIDFTVKNISATFTAIAPILAASYIDKGTNPPATPAHDVATFDTLYPGGISSIRAGVNPIQLAAGIHDICVRVDPYSAIAEANESNNLSCITFSVAGGVAATNTPPTSTGNPNLTIQSAPTYTPGSPFDQNGATINAIIQNIGAGAVKIGTNLFGTSEVKYELFEHVSGALVCSDTKTVNFDGMQPGGSIGLSIYLPSGTQCVNLLTVGTGYTIRITVDPANRVTESFDTDNERLLLFIPTVGAQAPTITPIPQVQSPSCVEARIVENNNAPGAATKGFKIECQTQNASSHKFFLSYSNTAGQTLTNTYGPSPIDPTTNIGSTNLAVTDMTSMDVICSACEGNVCTPLDNTAVASCKASFVNTLPTATPTPTPPSPLTINTPQGQAQITFDSTKPQNTIIPIDMNISIDSLALSQMTKVQVCAYDLADKHIGVGTPLIPACSDFSLPSVAGQQTYTLTGTFVFPYSLAGTYKLGAQAFISSTSGDIQYGNAARVTFSLVGSGGAATATPSVTQTLTPTVTGTPPVTDTPTITGTPTMTPTGTITPSVTQTLTPTVTGTPPVTDTPTITGTPTVTPPGGVATCDVTTNFDTQGGTSASNPYVFKYPGDNRRIELDPVLKDGRNIDRVCFDVVNIQNGVSGIARDDETDGYVISTDDNCESVTNNDNTPDTRLYALKAHDSSVPYTRLVFDVSIRQGAGSVHCIAARYIKVDDTCTAAKMQSKDLNCDGIVDKQDIKAGSLMVKIAAKAVLTSINGVLVSEIKNIIASLQ